MKYFQSDLKINGLDDVMASNCKNGHLLGAL